MSNYLIWKRQDSRNLKGLLISELPHIVRPAMRVQTIEIEGRDGDVSNDIGYVAYDKMVKIGLYNNYDVDKISHFFLGSGKVTFSNEPNKYYEAKISEQIDFERLVKFRTATVKFHTQPFKYLVDEKPTETEITDETKEITVTNIGFEESKPIMTLFGKDTVEVSVNGHAQFQINIDEEYVTVNSKLQECYKDNMYNLKNHNMGGDFPVLQPGKNVITWTGTLTKLIVYPESRWL